jgi:hypothetical protein
LPPVGHLTVKRFYVIDNLHGGKPRWQASRATTGQD